MVTLDVVKPVYEPAPPPPAMQPLYELAASGQVRGKDTTRRSGT